MLRLKEGSDSFAFADPAAGEAQSLRVFYFWPSVAANDSRIVSAMHGFDRAAETFRDLCRIGAELHGLLILVPEFSAQSFPDAYAYNYGNVRQSSPNAPLLPRALWNFGIIDRLFLAVREATGSNQNQFGIFGNSAGGQYVLRYLALTRGPRVASAVSANSGWYMLPDPGIDYPAGMGGIGADVTDVHRYLEQRLVILLGEADNDQDAADLPRYPAAMAQGPHRLARGRWHYDYCRTLAASIGVPFGWKLEIVPGAGHVSQVIYDRAMAVIAHTMRTQS
jgi:hypothetical protein